MEHPQEVVRCVKLRATMTDVGSTGPTDPQDPGSIPPPTPPSDPLALPQWPPLTPLPPLGGDDFAGMGDLSGAVAGAAGLGSDPAPAPAPAAPSFPPIGGGASFGPLAPLPEGVPFDQSDSNVVAPLPTLPTAGVGDRPTTGVRIRTINSRTGSMGSGQMWLDYRARQRGKNRKAGAILLAVLLGPVAWVMFYQQMWAVFWAAIVVWAGAIILAAHVSAALVLFGLIWIAVIIDIARRPVASFSR